MGLALGGGGLCAAGGGWDAAGGGSDAAGGGLCAAGSLMAWDGPAGRERGAGRPFEKVKRCSMDAPGGNDGVDGAWGFCFCRRLCFRCVTRGGAGLPSLFFCLFFLVFFGLDYPAPQGVSGSLLPRDLVKELIDACLKGQISPVGAVAARTGAWVPGAQGTHGSGHAQICRGG